MKLAQDARSQHGPGAPGATAVRDRLSRLTLPTRGRQRKAAIPASRPVTRAAA